MTDYKPEFWSAMVDVVNATITQRGVRFFRATVEDVRGGKVNIRRPYRDTPDGIYYPVVVSGHPPKAGDTVLCLATPGGVVVLGRPAGAGDSKLADYLPLTGGALTGDLDMDNNRIQNLPDPNGPAQPATKSYVDAADARKLDLSGGTMSGNLNMNTFRIQNLPDPDGPAQPATQNYVDTKLNFKQDKPRFTYNTDVIHVASGYTVTFTLPQTYYAPDSVVFMCRLASQSNFRFSASDASSAFRFYYNRQDTFWFVNNASEGAYCQLIARWW